MERKREIIKALASLYARRFDLQVDITSDTENQFSTALLEKIETRIDQLETEFKSL
jgi:hypothetical protein